MNTYGSIGNQTAGWYVRKLLRKAMPVLVLERFAQSYEQPQNETDLMEFRRRQPFSPATIPLTEGVPPRSSDFNYDSVSVKLQQFGDWSEITDRIQDTSKDRVLRDIAITQGEQIGETLERLTWDVVKAGTNAFYPGSVDNSADTAFTRTSVGPAHLLTAANQRRVTTFLESEKAKMFTEVLMGSEKYETFAIEASFVAVTHTDMAPSIRDLKGANNNDTFTPYSRYGASMRMVSPREIGAFEDVRYVTSPDLPPFRGAGATSTGSIRHTSVNSTDKVDVYPILYIGRDSFGCVALRGKKAVKPVVLRPDSMPSAADPLMQKGYAGWKTYFGCVILNDAWMCRLEAACPA